MTTEEIMLRYQIKSIDFVLDSIGVPKVSIKKPCPACGQIIKELEEEIIALRDRIHKLENELQAQDEPRHD